MDLLCSPNPKKNTQINYEYIPALKRKLPVFNGILSPSKSISTNLFIKLISMLEELKNKDVLEIGCGSGVLSILLGRRSASVTAIDVCPVAIKNTLLGLSGETKEVKEKITLGESDVFSNVYEITKQNNPKFDFIFFNNPLISSIPYTEEERMGFAGHNFETIIRALRLLPKFLFPSGNAFFLVSYFKEKFLFPSEMKKSYWNTEIFEKTLKLIPGLTYEYLNISALAYMSPEIEYRIVRIQNQSAK